MTAAAIRRLTLTNFRSYHAASLDVEANLVVLIGPNGAGKTNLIEAISFLMPGRGLRRATFEEVAFTEGDGSWAVSAEVEGMLGLATLGTGIEPPRGGRHDAHPAMPDRPRAGRLRGRLRRSSARGLAHAGDGPAVRRAGVRAPPLPRPPGARGRCRAPGRVNALERALRSRNRLLEEPRPDPHWLDAIEHETAELAVAVAALRAETVHRLQGALADRKDDAFPSAEIALDGWMERLLPDHPAVEIEDRYRGILKDNRARDAAAGRTLDGPHLTDLAVIYAPKSIPAADASTGEQKALLIGLVLAHAGLLAEMTGFAPVLLLDEVVAHLDPDRRAALYAALARLGAQVWMTGADPAAFADVASQADVFTVSPGQVQRSA